MELRRFLLIAGSDLPQPDREFPSSHYAHLRSHAALNVLGTLRVLADASDDGIVGLPVEFQPGHVPGLDSVRIEREFSQLLGGRRVEMITPKSLSPRIRDHILTSAEPLYSAGWLPG